MRTCALIGDSYLDYLPPGPAASLLPGGRVLNRALGGATVLDVAAQLLPVPDVYVLSIGTNDAATWFLSRTGGFDTGLRVLLDDITAPLVYLSPPGIWAEWLGSFGESNLDNVRHCAAIGRAMVTAHGGIIVDAAPLIAPLGHTAFDPDGIHLSLAGYAAIVPALREGIAEALSAPSSA